MTVTSNGCATRTGTAILSRTAILFRPKSMPEKMLARVIHSWTHIAVAGR